MICDTSLVNTHHYKVQYCSNSSWRQYPKKQQLYGHLPPLTKTIQVRRTRHAGHCWRSRDEFLSDELLWTPSHGWAKAGRSARTYIQQLCEDTGCSPDDLPDAMNDRERWGERLSDIRGTTRWWWDDYKVRTKGKVEHRSSRLQLQRGKTTPKNVLHMTLK